jgi:hypothetical protein
MPVRRKIDRRRKHNVPIEDADLLMRAGADYFSCLADYGFDPAPRPGLIEDPTMLAIWADWSADLEAAWIDPRSPFFMHPEQGEPWIYTVLRNHEVVTSGKVKRRAGAR